MYDLMPEARLDHFRRSSPASSCGTTTTSSRARRSWCCRGRQPNARKSTNGGIAKKQRQGSRGHRPRRVAATGAERRRDRDTFSGNQRIFTPEVIDDIHIKSELGRYRMRGFSLFKKIPHWDDLTFLPGTLTRFVIEGYREKCETKTVIGPKAKRPLVLDIPVYVTGMSFGALSYEAKIALARGATMAGSATCSGEGGMIPDERRYSIEVVLPVHPVALRVQPAPSAAGRCLRVLHRPGLQGRARRPSDGPEGDRPGGRDALAAGRHRPALAGAPSGLARAGRSGAQDPGNPRSDQPRDPDPAEARRGARL